MDNDLRKRNRRLETDNAELIKNHIELEERNRKLEAAVEAAQDFLKWSEKEGQRDNWMMGEFDELWIKLRDALADLEDANGNKDSLD